MKKVLKYVMVLTGIVILIVLSAFLYITVSGIPSYETEKIDIKVEITPERLERGEKLATMLCGNCHTNSETGLFTGQQMKDAPKEFGTIYSQNITQDPEYGIGSWTDGELIYLLRTGIKKDGKYSPPYMAKLPHMADEDLYSIIAFLRSDDPRVAADNTKDKPCEPTFLTKMLSHVAFKPLPMPDHKIEVPDPSDKVAMGKYLVINLDCFPCHSEDFKTMNIMEPEKTPGFMGGGNKPLNMEGKVMLTPNLTPDKETGIGMWSEEKFIRVLKTGIKEGEPALRYPMLPFTKLSDEEASAIYAYLQTIPPINNKVSRSAFE